MVRLVGIHSRPAEPANLAFGEPQALCWGQDLEFVIRRHFLLPFAQYRQVSGLEPRNIRRRAFCVDMVELSEFGIQICRVSPPGVLHVVTSLLAGGHSSGKAQESASHCYSSSDDLARGLLTSAAFTKICRNARRQAEHQWLTHIFICEPSRKPTADAGTRNADPCCSRGSLQGFVHRVIALDLSREQDLSKQTRAVLARCPHCLLLQLENWHKGAHAKNDI